MGMANGARRTPPRLRHHAQVAYRRAGPEGLVITELVHGWSEIGRTGLGSKSHARGLKISHSLQVSLVIGCTELAIAAGFTTDSRC
jgi:hypothetical protein